MTTTSDECCPIFRKSFVTFLTNRTFCSRVNPMRKRYPWDSLAHVNLITAIEKCYKVKFALGELQRLKHVDGLVDLLVKNQVNMRSADAPIALTDTHSICFHV